MCDCAAVPLKETEPRPEKQALFLFWLYVVTNYFLCDRDGELKKAVNNKVSFCLNSHFLFMLMLQCKMSRDSLYWLLHHASHYNNIEAEEEL